jgi:hypothetical protein
MSSFIRRLQRKAKRNVGSFENAPEIVRDPKLRPRAPGYEVCHRTKGFKRVGQLRVLAQNQLRHIAEVIELRRGPIRPRSPKGRNARFEADLAAANAKTYEPYRETRQQRRAANY